MQHILDSMTFLRPALLAPCASVYLLCCQSFDLLCLCSLAISALICRVIPGAQPEPQPQSRCLEISVNYFAITRLTAHSRRSRSAAATAAAAAAGTGNSNIDGNSNCNSNIAGIGPDTELLIAVAEAALTEGISIALCCQFECQTTKLVRVVLGV